METYDVTWAADHVLNIAMDRPDVLNAQNPLMWHETKAVFDAALGAEHPRTQKWQQELFFLINAPAIQMLQSMHQLHMLLSHHSMWSHPCHLRHKQLQHSCPHW